MIKHQKGIATTAMIFLILSVLLTSFQIAIYGDTDYTYYQKEYEKYKVTESLDMTIEDVMYVTEEMMAYLIGDREELSVVTMVDGKEQDFFNEQDRLHMADVKNLFLGGLKLRTALFFVSLCMLLLLKMKKVSLSKVVPGSYYRALAICGGTAAVLGGMFSVDFTRYFTIFHEIFFTNDLWIFDPATDYMIRMLPEGFFYDMVMRIGIIFFGILMLLFVLCLGWNRIIRTANKTV